jgi:hypothetical protein
MQKAKITLYHQEREGFSPGGEAEMEENVYATMIVIDAHPS